MVQCLVLRSVHLDDSEVGGMRNLNGPLLSWLQRGGGCSSRSGEGMGLPLPLLPADLTIG
jgi:hypothetical protein